MKLDREGWITAGIAAAVVAILAYQLNGRIPLSHMKKQPEKTERPVTFWDDFYSVQNATYFVHPNEIADPVMLPVRYPPRPGHELSSLIDKGYAPLFRPRADLYDWANCPPAETP